MKKAPMILLVLVTIGLITSAVLLTQIAYNTDSISDAHANYEDVRVPLKRTHMFFNKANCREITVLDREQNKYEIEGHIIFDYNVEQDTRDFEKETMDNVYECITGDLSLAFLKDDKIDWNVIHEDIQKRVKYSLDQNGCKLVQFIAMVNE